MELVTVAYALWFLSSNEQQVRLAEYWSFKDCQEAKEFVRKQDTRNDLNRTLYVCVPLSGRNNGETP